MISIIIPAYNSAATIMEALESVLSQSSIQRSSAAPPDYEVIIVDDGSTDNTVLTLNTLIKKSEQKERKETKGCGFAAEGGNKKSSLFPSFPSVQISSGWIVHVAVPVSLCRQRAGSLSMDERKFLPQVLRVIAKANGPGGALAGLPEWKNAALATQYQQASWMAFCRGERALTLKHLGVAVWRNLCGPRRIQKPWLRLTYRYLVGHPPGEEDFTTDLRNLGNQEGRGEENVAVFVFREYLKQKSRNTAPMNSGNRF